MKMLENWSAATAAFLVCWAANTAVLAFLQVKPTLALIGAQLYGGGLFLVCMEIFKEGGRVLDRRRCRKHEGRHG